MRTSLTSRLGRASAALTIAGLALFAANGAAQAQNQSPPLVFHSDQGWDTSGSQVPHNYGWNNNGWNNNGWNRNNNGWRGRGWQSSNDYRYGNGYGYGYAPGYAPPTYYGAPQGYSYQPNPVGQLLNRVMPFR